MSQPKILMQHEIESLKVNKFRIGHPSYNGSNAAKYHNSYSDAFNDLLSRGILMADAHIVLKKAMDGSFACARKHKCTMNVTEVIYCN